MVDCQARSIRMRTHDKSPSIPTTIPILSPVGSLNGRRVLHLSELEITDEPIHLPGEKRPAELEQRNQELFDGVQQRPREMIPILKDLIAKYPKVPQLSNWLASAYGGTEQLELYKQTVIHNYQQFPKYLFARINYAQLLLERGEAKAVLAVFGGKMDLASMYPNRRKFHITEFLSFSAIQVWYLVQMGESEAAKPVYDVMQELAPRNPLVKQTRRILNPGWFKKMLVGVLKRLAGSNKTKPSQEAASPAGE